MIIYISHPYSGLEENKQKIEEIIKELVREHPEHTYLSPIHTFGFMYYDFSYEQGLEMCLKLLDKCDMMYVYGDWKRSRGCNAEVLYCENNAIPYEIKN